MTEDTQSATAIVADDHPLRGASVAALIAPWVSGWRVWSASPQAILAGRDEVQDPRILIISLGGSSLHSTLVMNLADDLIVAYAGVPCVALSDRNEPDEAAFAARIGLQAFIPTSVAHAMGEQVFSFVLGGGTYFPREALLRPVLSQGATRNEARTTGDPGHLTRRQIDVLELLRLGRSNKHIGRDLDMSEATVKVHVRQIMRKLGVANRTQAALIAGQQSVTPSAGNSVP